MTIKLKFKKIVKKKFKMKNIGKKTRFGKMKLSLLVCFNCFGALYLLSHI